MKRINKIAKVFAGVLLGAAVFMAGCKKEEAPVKNEYKIGSTVACGDYSGTITGMVTMDNDNMYEESGSLVFDEVDEEGYLVFTTDDSDNNVRLRALFEGGEGVEVKEGDMLVVEYEPTNDFPCLELYIDGLTSGPEEWDSSYIANFNYKNGFCTMKLRDGFVGEKLYAIRIKGDGAPKDTQMIFKHIFVMTDVKAPEEKTYSYEISDSVEGVTVTYYNDIFSRGVAWRTVDEEGADNCLQYVAKKDVSNILTYDWEKGLAKGKVKVVKDYFGKEIENSDGSAVYYCHKAHVENLKEGSEYYYRVGGESVGYSVPGIWTVKGKLDDFILIDVTDPQAESESEYRQYENLIREAFKKAYSMDSTLVGYVTTGDITNENHDGNLFIDEFDMAVDFDADDIMNTVTIPVAGNHDVTEDVFFSMFDIDFANYCSCGEHNAHRTGGCYSLVIGNVYLIATNSNESGDLEGPGNGEYDGRCDYHEQYAWINERLEEANELREKGKVDWIIVTTHAGMMSVGYHTMDGGSRELRKNLVPLFAKYSVDLVLQGHDHAYTRTNPYYYGKDVNGNYFPGTIPNERETGNGFGTITYDDPYTSKVERVGRVYNIEPEGTHYVTMNYAGEKSLDISKENAESRYKVPDSYIEEGCAISPVNGDLCGLKVRKQFYGIVHVKGNILTLDTYSFNGVNSSLYDTFTVIKDGKNLPDIEKRDVSFEGINVFDKTYDGKAAEMDIFDITAMKIGTDEVETLFREYDDIIYRVTGKTKAGVSYDSNTLPTEAGTYTLHAIVADTSRFYKGETTIEFVIE